MTARTIHIACGAAALAAFALAGCARLPGAEADAAAEWPALWPLPEVLAPAADPGAGAAGTDALLARGAALRGRADALRAAQP